MSVAFGVGPLREIGGFTYSSGESVSWAQSGTSGTLTVSDGARTASLTLDGTPVYSTPVPVNANWSVLRLELTNSGKDGAHILEGTNAFGVQVIGYGAYTSYQYPAGLDLVPIAPPPPILH